MNLSIRADRGIALIYMVFILPVVVAFCAIAVDLGRLQLARSEAQAVADAAAKYAAYGLVSSSLKETTAFAHASAVVAASKVDGSAPALAQYDIVRGTWDADQQTFVANSAGDAVKVTIRQKLNRAGAAPLFMRILNASDDTEVIATAVAWGQTVEVEIQPPAAGNLWLSGMPDNTLHKNFRPDANWVWDSNGTSSNKMQRPLELDLAAVNLHPGDTIALEGITGTASWVTGGSKNSADGDTSYIVANGVAPANSLPNTNANGMSNTRAPIGAVMAVFLSDNAPTSGSTPANLDFGTAAQRDYSSISPQLKQVFYIGDGKRSNGESQRIVVPEGATRVFFGMMDAWQWNDNTGNFKAKLYSQTSTHLVK